jgi:hypothetical protein
MARFDTPQGLAHQAETPVCCGSLILRRSTYEKVRLRLRISGPCIQPFLNSLWIDAFFQAAKQKRPLISEHIQQGKVVTG